LSVEKKKEGSLDAQLAAAVDQMSENLPHFIVRHRQRLQPLLDALVTFLWIGAAWTLGRWNAYLLMAVVAWAAGRMLIGAIQTIRSSLKLASLLRKPHCSACGQLSPPADDRGFTRCCNYRVCFGRQDRDPQRACAAALALLNSRQPSAPSSIWSSQVADREISFAKSPESPLEPGGTPHQATQSDTNHYIHKLPQDGVDNERRE
jgi:hypothetical protein